MVKLVMSTEQRQAYGEKLRPYQRFPTVIVGVNLPRATVFINLTRLLLILIYNPFAAPKEEASQKLLGSHGMGRELYQLETRSRQQRHKRCN